MLLRLQAYRERFGTAIVPRTYWEDPELGAWCMEIRLCYTEGIKWVPGRSRCGLLSPAQQRALEDADFPFKPLEKQAMWHHWYQELRRWHQLYGHVNVPQTWEGSEAVGFRGGKSFSRWVHAQSIAIRKCLLHPSQVKKLHELGLPLGGPGEIPLNMQKYCQAYEKHDCEGQDQVYFSRMLEKLRNWRQRYYTAIVPRQVHDDAELGEWVHNLRKLHKLGKLHGQMLQDLDELGFAFIMDPATSKWHYCFHEARRYKESYGTALIPEDLRSRTDPGFVEAAAWMRREALHFSKQKLSEKRLVMIQDILGLRFEREYAPVKRSKHKYISWPIEAITESQLQPQDREQSMQLRQSRGPIRQTNSLVPPLQKPHVIHAARASRSSQPVEFSIRQPHNVSSNPEAQSTS
ncbi:hypothetical protein WJX84_001587 [Apatococcus fuscideae]